jgi:DNA-binding SARP family transcriptional activator
MPIVERRALIDRLAAARAVGLEAPSGFGKSTVVAQLMTVLDLPSIRVDLRDQTDLDALFGTLSAGATRAGLSAIGSSFDASDPVASAARVAAAGPLLLAVDEVQRATAPAAEWLAHLGERAPEMRLVIAGRRLPAALSRFAANSGTVASTDELRFDRDDVYEVLAAGGAAADDATADAVLRLTDGWPAAVQLAAQTLGAGAETTLSAPSGRVLRALVDHLIEGLDAGDQTTLRLLASLPWLSRSVVDAVGGRGAFDRMLDTGLPLRTQPTGWHELPDAIREALDPLPLPVDAAIAVAGLYGAAGEVVDASRLLWAAGQSAALCALVAAQPRERLQRSGLALFEPIVDGLPDEVLAEHPDALVQLVRAAERHDRLREAWTERARALIRVGTPAHRALSAEMALAEARAGHLSEGRTKVDNVLAAATSDEVVTIGRAHLVRAYTLIVGDTAGATNEALIDLEQAAARFRLANERTWEADTHQAAGFGCHYTNGRYEAAIESLERSLALRPAPDAGRAQGLTYLAEVMIRTGRVEDAAVALREARAIAQRLGDERSIAYVAWTTAELHAQRRDAVAAITALEEAEAHSGDVARSLAGIDFLVDSSRIRMLVGDRGGALRELERAEQIARGTAREDLPLTARARFEILFGDARAGLAAIDRLDASSVAYRGERWSRALFRAAALARLRDRAGSAAVLAEMRAALAAEGDPERAARLEPELLALVEPAQANAESASLRVTMLGGFAVERGTADITPPAGLASTLVKLLALRGTLTVDEAMDLLWPESETELDPVRIRNLLHRIRATSGELVERVDDTGLRLAPGTVIDARSFEDAAAAELSASAPERAALARRALAWSTGELLPADRYQDWADLPRERIRRRRLALLDLVADDAMEHGDLDEAARVLDAAIEDDPLEEVRYVRLARALLSQGRTRAVLAVARRGVKAARELGVEPRRDLREVIASIAAVEGRPVSPAPTRPSGSRGAESR